MKYIPLIAGGRLIGRTHLSPQKSPNEPGKYRKNIVLQIPKLHPRKLGKKVRSTYVTTYIAVQNMSVHSFDHHAPQDFEQPLSAVYVKVRRDGGAIRNGRQQDSRCSSY